MKIVTWRRKASRSLRYIRAGFSIGLLALATSHLVTAQEAPPVYRNILPPEAPAPPPSAPPQAGNSDLELLVAPIALYPDPLLAALLPAAAYPLEITEAARFVSDTNNLASLDGQDWDDNVKAVARFPTVIQYMDRNINWTKQLGQAFVDQPLDVMNAIQAMRAQAIAVGALTNTDQQTVNVTNGVVQRSYGSQIVYVTNSAIEIAPANPQVIYVPTYNPETVYYPSQESSAASVVAPLVTFGAGIALGAVLANNCDWYYGGVYYGGGGGYYWGGHPPYYPPPPGYRPPPYRPPPGDWRPPSTGERPPGVGGPRPTPLPSQRPGEPGGSDRRRWQPDQGRRQNYVSTGGPGSSWNPDARGWGNRTPTQMPAQGTGRVGNRPSTGTLPSYNRPATPSRPSPSPGISQPSNRARQPSTSPGSAFGGSSNGRAARASSNRGAASRGGGGGARGGRR